jgi:hypothetical protein
MQADSSKRNKTHYPECPQHPLAGSSEKVALKDWLVAGVKAAPLSDYPFPNSIFWCNVFPPVRVVGGGRESTISRSWVTALTALQLLSAHRGDATAGRIPSAERHVDPADLHASGRFLTLAHPCGALADQPAKRVACLSPGQEIRQVHQGHQPHQRQPAVQVFAGGFFEGERLFFFKATSAHPHTPAERRPGAVRVWRQRRRPRRRREGHARCAAVTFVSFAVVAARGHGRQTLKLCGCAVMRPFSCWLGLLWWGGSGTGGGGRRKVSNRATSATPLVREVMTLALLHGVPLSLLSLATLRGGPSPNDSCARRTPRVCL